MHAAHLVAELKKRDPTLTFSGLGGSQMRENGVELYLDMTALAVVGFFEVLKYYGRIKKAFDLILEKAVERQPLAVILVDYPGFNLRLAKALKAHGIKVIYYISPQVWAWKENRVYQIKKHVDKMLVLFEFEKDFYARFGVDVAWVGHPLTEIARARTSKEEFLRLYGLHAEKLTIGLLPGSREKEVEGLLPVMLKAADILVKEFPKIQFLVLKAPSLPSALLERFTSRRGCQPVVIDGQTYDGIHACDICMVASGTATLETAILEKPMVVLYKTSFLTWLLAKLLVKIKNIALVNVVAGKRIVPECVQFEATGANVAACLRAIFTDEVLVAGIKSELKKVRDSLGGPGSSARAAAAVLEAVGTV